MPFTITSSTNAAFVGVKLCKRDFIWSAISLSIQISFIWMAINFYRGFLSHGAFTSTIYFGNLTIWFVSLLLGISVMALDLINRRSIVQILNKVTVFDTEVRKWFVIDRIIAFFSQFISRWFVLESTSTTKWATDMHGCIVARSYFSAQSYWPYRFIRTSIFWKTTPHSMWSNTLAPGCIKIKWWARPW